MTSVVLLSGGLDSTVAAFFAAQQGPVHALSVEYGQRHWCELACARRIAKKVGAVSHEIVNFGMRGIGLPSSLTGAGDSPIVPGRNTFMLTLAAARAQVVGATRIVIGCSGDDAADFPDCRAPYLMAAQSMLRLAYDLPDLVVCAPLVDRSKAQTLAMARSLGDECWNALRLTWTCYAPTKAGGTSGKWLACGSCKSCALRAKGFAEAGETDPALGVEVAA